LKYDVIPKDNLLTKLEYKSSQTATRIDQLPNYMTISSMNNLFKTPNNTFQKEFDKNKHNLKWLNINENKEYIMKNIENILQSQIGKIYMIWNSSKRKMFLDMFSENKLLVKDLTISKNESDLIFNIQCEFGSHTWIKNLDSNSFICKFNKNTDRNDLFFCGEQKIKSINRCIDVPYFSENEEEYLVSYECNDAGNQEWIYDKKNRLMSIFNEKCIDIDTESGYVYQKTCNELVSQKWIFEDGKLKSEKDGKCVTVDKNSYIKVVECKKALKWNEILRY